MVCQISSDGWMARAYFKNNDILEDIFEKNAVLITWCIIELEFRYMILIYLNSAKICVMYHNTIKIFQCFVIFFES